MEDPLAKIRDHLAAAHNDVATIVVTGDIFSHAKLCEIAQHAKSHIEAAWAAMAENPNDITMHHSHFDPQWQRNSER
jgi:hypothetical protein